MLITVRVRLAVACNSVANLALSGVILGFGQHTRLCVSGV